MKVSVIGTGYVGLVSGVCLAEVGHEVTCVDVDASKVTRIMKGEPPIHENGLPELLGKVLAAKRFTATRDLRAAVHGSDLTLIAVGTPFDGQRIDLTFVKAVAKELGEALKDKAGYHVVVVKSTVVPGTTDSVVKPILEQASGKRCGPDFGVGMNPEFLTEGQAIVDFMNPDRIVLGAMDGRALEVLDGLYAPFQGVPRVRTNPRTAEMIKYASNAMLATAISFSNELGNLCAALGDVDVVDVMEGLHLAEYLTVKGADGQRRKAPIASFFFAGCGFGGSCLPKDVKALAAHGAASGAPMPLLESVITVNRGQPGQVLKLLEKGLGELAGKKVGVLGLAFKPDTDDVRESPAFPIIRLLQERKVAVKAYDPVAAGEARKVLGDSVAYAPSAADCVAGVDAVVLVTRWKEFEAVPALLRAMPNPPLLVDGRRQLDKRQVPRYAGIGL
ncbi:MAG: UDP-glucose/GDP-mannose dehydrogenase family protein [Anaeromyxobacter sp.]